MALRFKKLGQSRKQWNTQRDITAHHYNLTPDDAEELMRALPFNSYNPQWTDLEQVLDLLVEMEWDCTRTTATYAKATK